MHQTWAESASEGTNLQKAKVTFDMLVACGAKLNLGISEAGCALRNLKLDQGGATDEVCAVAIVIIECALSKSEYSDRYDVLVSRVANWCSGRLAETNDADKLASVSDGVRSTFNTYDRKWALVNAVAECAEAGWPSAKAWVDSRSSLEFYDYLFPAKAAAEGRHRVYSVRHLCDYVAVGEAFRVEYMRAQNLGHLVLHDAH